MSINVHVSGNPISIKRGKMVTAELDQCKKEFDKRRLIRLEQVRQQSKDIAEGLRNKVKKEKKMQIREIEEDGKQKLKNWQNRKLLELQTQYQQAIKELGVAHKAAQEIGDENELLAEQDRDNKETAGKRGKTAENKLNSEKLRGKMDKALAEQRRQIVREIENTRAHMVTKTPKPKRAKAKKRRHRSQGDMSVTTSDSDEESTAESNELSDIEEHGEMEESSSCSCGATVSEISGVTDGDHKEKSHRGGKYLEEQPPPMVPPLHLVSDDSPTIQPPNNTPLIPPSRLHISPPVSPKKISKSTYDTRISDRIKHRGLICGDNQEFDNYEATHVPLVDSNTNIRDFIHSRSCHADCVCCCGRRGYSQKSKADQALGTRPEVKNKEVDATLKEDQSVQTSAVKMDFTAQKSDEIPSQPSIRLKSSSVEEQRSKSSTKDRNVRKESVSPSKVRKESLSPAKIRKKSSSPAKDAKKSKSPTRMSSSSKVLVYDHPNRFSYEKSIPSGSFVEKIPIESLEYVTDPASEEERLEAVNRRERDARTRGRKALEKERLQREYEEMLKKLPLLQKKERICEIYNDKPEYHMSEDRLKEKERERQNNLENVYNKLFPNLKPAVVTLPKTNRTEGDQASNEGSVHSINVAEWDVDYQVPHRFSSQEVQEIIKEFVKHKPRDRRTKLKELLKRLEIQKEELLRAISVLPKNDSLDELINDLRSFDNEGRGKSKSGSGRTRKRSRKENEADTSIDSSQEDVRKKEETEVNRRTGRSPRKKAKTKPKPNVIILQNTSTQTTPKPEKRRDESNTKTEKRDGTKKVTKICDKLHVPCDCNKENRELSEDLCHIFIKLHDNDTPEVLVKAKDKEKASRTVLTKHTTVGTQISPKTSRRTKTKPTEAKTCQTDATTEKSRTWRDQFSKNSLSTTSTSYLSPPDFMKTKNSEKSSLYNLKTKPQQQELSSSAFSSTKYQDYSLDHHPDAIKPFVKKLLSMTKVAVDDLSITTSNVETPSQSIIEMESNIPKQDLRQMVESFKNRIDGIAQGLSYSPDVSPVPFNTSASSSSKSHKEVAEKRSGTSLNSNEDLVTQYAKISDSVTKRIQTLAGMIEKLRDEKVKMLQISGTKTRSFQDKDFSTSYMDLPDLKSSSTSKSSSLDDEEILKKLMEIDREAVDGMGKIRSGSKDEDDGTKSSEPKHKNSTSPNTINQEIIQRLQRLKEQETVEHKQEEQSFVPFLSDIPKLPKFEPELETGQNHKRPPPSKGLTTAKKFNGNISLIPHELSTIVEADSQMSTKLPSPEASELNVNVPLLTIPELQERVSLESDEGKFKKSPRMSPKPKEMSKSSSGSSKYKTTSNKDDSTSGGIPTLLISSSSGSNKCDDSTCAINLRQFSSSSSDDMETIESMLRSIGMDWAIPTLHKTQEALALGSSSSSLDLSKKFRNEGSGSEISLKDYLRKQLLGRVSSSTMLSDGTPASFLGEHSEVSGIQGACSSGEKSKQRTSTPINVSKSTSKSKAVFTDSDLSSIKQDNSKSRRKS